MASYEQNKNNKLWSVRFRELDLKDGTEKNKRLSGFKTKREAQAAYHEHVKHYDEERALLASAKAEHPQLEMTFDQLAELYFQSLAGNNREATIITYRSKYNRGIEEFFKGRILSSIKQIDIVEWKNWLTAKGYSYGYKDDIRTVLNFIFKFGEDTFDMKNVAKKVKGFRNTDFGPACEEEKAKFLPPDQVQKLLDSVEDEEYRLFFLTLYQTGCRRGEIFALRWSDVDPEKRIIHITKSLTRKVKPYEVTPPKTKQSVRDIPISDTLVMALRRQAERYGYDAPFLFGGTSPLPERTGDRYIALAADAAGVPRITMHGLRHSCASALISRHINLVAVGKRLGHKNISETVNTYGHLLPTDSDLMIEILDEIH